MVGPAPGLEVHVELGELQLHVTDVMQEEHQEAYVVVPAEWGQSPGLRSGPSAQGHVCTFAIV